MKPPTNTPAFAPGARVTWHGVAATVTSVHRNGKTYGIVTDNGKTTFTRRDALKAAA